MSLQHTIQALVVSNNVTDLSGVMKRNYQRTLQSCEYVKTATVERNV